MIVVIKINDQLVKEAHFQYGGRDCIVIFNCYGFRYGYVSLKSREIIFHDYHSTGQRSMIVSYKNSIKLCNEWLTSCGLLIPELFPNAEYYIGFESNRHINNADFGAVERYGLINDDYHSRNDPKLSVLSLEQCIQECKSIADQLNKQLEEK